MRITIFTPTYNRAYTLKKLYTSLVNQTNKHFEWLVIDDGSTDDTKELINEFINQEKIVIRYFYQENGGKASAYNLGISKANSELFACVDSDDYLRIDAIDTIMYTWKHIDKAVGIITKRVGAKGNKITTMNDFEYKYTTLKGAYDRDLLKGDTFLIYKTDSVKKFKFPKFEGEKFVPESYLYDQLDQLGDMYLLNKDIYISEYLDDGYTRNFDKVIANNPNGYLAYLMQRIKLEKSLKNLYFYLARIVSIALVLNTLPVIDNHRFLSILAYPLGCYLYLKRFRKWKLKNMGQKIL